MEYYVYELIDPYTSTIFYIGKGCKKRMYDHVDAVKKNRLPNGSNTKLANKIKKILRGGLKIQYKKVLITEHEQKAYNKENELIQKREIRIVQACYQYGIAKRLFSGMTIPKNIVMRKF